MFHATPPVIAASSVYADWLKPETPPFRLTRGQRATLAACRTADARVMHLQNWHQAHCWAHRQIVGVFGSLDPAAFSRRWDAAFGDMAWAGALARDSAFAAGRGL